MTFLKSLLTLPALLLSLSGLMSLPVSASTDKTTVVQRSESVANICRDYRQAGNQFGCAEYRYDPIRLHFRDANGTEHAVTAHRVYAPNGQVIQADLDFELTCNSQCVANRESAINAMYWGFRNAILSSNGFYIYRPCGSSSDACCDELGCSAILKTPAQSDAQTMEIRATSKGKNIMEGINTTASGLTIYQAVSGQSRNEHQARQLFNSMQTSPSNVVLISVGQLNAICIENTNTGTCDLVKSDIDTFLPDEPTYKVSEVNEQQANDIRTFLFRFNNIRHARQCETQKMECSFNRCKLTVRCYKPR
jgi:hypothetical protein